MSALAREPVPDASLATRLHARIARDGPLTVEEFMQACLSDEVRACWRLCLPPADRRQGRLHHVAGDQPDLRRARRPLGGGGVAVHGRAVSRDGRRARTWARYSDGRCFSRLARRSEIPRQRLRGVDRDEPGHGRGAAQDAQGCGRTASLVCGARRGAGRSAGHARQRIRRCAAHPAIHPPRRGLARAVDRERRPRRLHLY